MNSLERHLRKKEIKDGAAAVYRGAKDLLSVNGNRLNSIIGLLFTAVTFMGGYYLCYTLIYFFRPILAQTGPDVISYADFIGFAAGNVAAVFPLIGLRFAVCEGQKSGRIVLSDIFTVYAFGRYTRRFLIPVLFSLFRTAGVWAVLAGWVFHGHYIPIGGFVKTVSCIAMLLLWLFATRMPVLYSWMRLYGIEEPGRVLWKMYSDRRSGKTFGCLRRRLFLNWLLSLPTVFIYAVAVCVPSDLAANAVFCAKNAGTDKSEYYPERKTL